MSNYETVSASGYKSIRNAVDESRVIVHPEIIEEHRCNALTPQIADRSLFNGFGPCDSKILLRHRAKGIAVQGMGRNSQIDSTTPTECVTAISAGNWAVSQQKYAGIDQWEKCDFQSFLNNVNQRRDWVFDDFIDRQAMQMITSINPCVIDRCGKLKTGTDTAPLKMNVDTSHQVFSQIQNAKFTNCDGRKVLLILPDCERGVLTGNKEVNEHFKHCCGVQAPQFTGEFPELNGIRVMFSRFVPWKDCGDGTRVYTAPAFPMGAFGYASLVAHMETINTDANLKHFSFAQRLILKYAMGIADPTDFLNFKMKFTSPDVELDTCGI